VREIFNDDLTYNIYLANKGCTPQYAFGWFFPYTPYIALMSLGLAMRQGQTGGDLLIGMLSGISGSVLFGGVLLTLYAKLGNETTDDRFKLIAIEEINRLAERLRESGVDTDFELLKTTTEDRNQRKYNFVFSSRFPRLVQTKYYLVPTNEMVGTIRQCSYIKQEHQLFPYSMKRIISIGEPKKTLKLVPIKANF